MLLTFEIKVEEIEDPKKSLESNSKLNQIDPFLKFQTNYCQLGGLHCSEVAFLLLTQQAQVQFSAFPKIYFDVAEIYQQRCLEESGQRHENVDRIHLVLASSTKKFSLMTLSTLGSCLLVAVAF